MRKIQLKLSLFAVVLLTIAATSNLFGQETKIKESDLPSAVIKAFHTEYPSAKIVGTAKEVEKGVTYFEIESKDGKVGRDLLYTKAGKVAEIEEALTAKSIPSFVKKSIEKKFKKVEYKRGEKNIRNSITKYEIVIESSEVKYEVVCDAKGNITKSTKLKNTESDEKDNDWFIQFSIFKLIIYNRLSYLKVMIAYF